MKAPFLSLALAAGCFFCAPGAYCQADSPDVETQVNAILTQMTLEEKLDYDWTEAGSIPSPIPSSDQATFSARWTGQIVPTVSGDQVFKVRADGGFRLVVNGQTLIDLFNSPPLPSPSDIIGPTAPSSAKIQLVAGQAYTVELDYRRVSGFFGIFGGLEGVQFSWAALEPPPNLARYDAVILCEGISNEYEGEGIDRPFQLPEFQDELIQNVSRLNPRTVVVLHGGGSFDVQPWVQRVSGLLHAWYPGQNGGQALGEILFGKVNPSAKLPITWEKRIEDNPAFASFPMPLNGNAKEIEIAREYLSAIGATRKVVSNRSSRSGSGCLIRRSLNA